MIRIALCAMLLVCPIGGTQNALGEVEWTWAWIQFNVRPIIVSSNMDNLYEDDVSVQEMELLEPNYEVFMKWSQPTTIWDTFSNRIRMATIR